RIEVMRLDDEDLNLLSSRAAEPERLGRANVHFVHQRVVEMREPLRRSLRRAIDLGWLSDGTSDVEQRAVVRDFESVDGLVGEDMRDRAARDIDALNRIDSIVWTGEDNRLRVVAPIEVVNPIQVSLADH